MKIILLNILITLILISGQFHQQKNEQNLTINSTLQVKATSILKNKLSEINALSGQVIIMEVQTGQIKALVGLERKDSANYQSCKNFAHAQESGLIQPISILAALETGKIKLSNTVDVKNGIYHTNGKELKDHNWFRGGYGKITIKEGLALSSNIAIYKTIEKTFDKNIQSYFDILSRMDYGKPDSINGITNLQPVNYNTHKDRIQTYSRNTWFCLGYDQNIAPIQMLTFYNAIANNGKMVKPLLYKTNTIIINPQIASRANIDSLKQALQFVVTDGLGKMAQSSKIHIAGKTGTIQLKDKSYLIELCGYFPANSPKYSIIISIHKKTVPASGTLIGDMFKQIAEYIINIK